MRRLIVNADDFGLTPGVNRAVVEGHVRGIVTSATVMVNMPAFEEAVALARAHPRLGVGLHFNITQGRPVADPAWIPSLVNERGEFLGTSGRLAKRMMRGQLSIDEVRIELRSQVERAQAAGLRLTHIDSHKHAHALPAIYGAAVEIAEEFGIGAVRGHRALDESGPLTPAFLKQRLVALGLSQLGAINARRFARSSVRSPYWLFGVARTGFWTRDWLLGLLDRLPNGVSELMCHPGYDDEGLRAAGTRLRASRETELALLTDPIVRARAAERGIRLVDFSCLAE